MKRIFLLASLAAAAPVAPLPVDPDWSSTGTAGDNSYFGFHFAAADVDGDGFDDLVVGAAGAGALFVYGGSEAGPSDVPRRIDLAHDSVASAGDVNGDGYGDIVVGASAGIGRIHLFMGRPSGLSDLPDLTLSDTFSNTGYGWAVACAGDVNGDGLDDVIVGAPTTAGRNGRGAAYLYLGSATTGLPMTASATLSLSEVSASAWAQYGQIVASAGDVNGDGFDDIAVGAPRFDRFGDDAGDGAVFVHLGSAAGISTTPDWQRLGEWGTGLGAAISTAGDVDGDGDDELLVGAPGEANLAGVAYLFGGSVDGLSDMPDRTYTGVARFDGLGGRLAGGGDVDGDGYDDVLIASPGLRWPGTAEAWGEVSLFRGGPGGLSDTTEWSVRGEFLRTGFGESLGLGGDLNGDGAADVIVGAYSWYWNGTTYGRIYAWNGAEAEIPSSLGQHSLDGTAPLPTGATLSESGFTIKGDVQDAHGRSVRLEVEVKPVGVAFNGDSLLSAPSAGGTLSVTVSDLPIDTAWHWRARGVAGTGVRSSWLSFGGNAESEADLRTRPNAAPSVSRLRQSDPTTGAVVPPGGRTPWPSIALGALADDGDISIDGSERVGLELEVRSADRPFTGTPTVSSAPALPGSEISVVIALPPTAGSFHWQARARDRYGKVGSWVEGSTFQGPTLGSTGGRCGLSSSGGGALMVIVAGILCLMRRSGC